MKKKLLFVIDSEEWTLGHIAHYLKNNLSNDFDIDIVTLSMLNDNIVKVLLLSKQYDLTHFLWRGQLLWLDDQNSRDYIDTLGFDYDRFINEYVTNNHITTTICDHLYLTDKEISNTKYIIDLVDSYIVTSKKLYNIYSDLFSDNKPYAVIHDGVDTNRFNPKNKKKHSGFIIGWAGNSKFTDSENDDDLKGVNLVIKPAIKEITKEGYDISINIADKNTNFIPYDKMPEYYGGLDLYICASKTEGTPAPILESMATGIPVISTDVGIVSEAFETNEKDFILKERSKQCMKDAIIKMYNMKDKSKIINENIDAMKKWDWKEVSKQYKKFFEYNLKNK